MPVARHVIHQPPVVIAPAAFTPPDIAGLGFWYDASDLATITESGGAVSQWDDKSGNGRHLLQGTGSAQPTTGSRTQNGLNVIDFDGASDFMDTSATFDYGHQWTVFLVVLSDDGADGTAQSLVRGNSSTQRGVVTKQTTNVWRMNSGANLDRGTPNTSPVLLTCRFNGAGSSLRINGVQSGATGDAGNNTALDDFRVGANQTPANFWDGWMGELIGYAAALSSDDMGTVESHLQVKWGL